MPLDHTPPFAGGILVGLVLGAVLLGVHLVLARIRADRRARANRAVVLARLAEGQSDG